MGDEIRLALLRAPGDPTVIEQLIASEKLLPVGERRAWAGRRTCAIPRSPGAWTEWIGRSGAPAAAEAALLAAYVAFRVEPTENRLAGLLRTIDDNLPGLRRPLTHILTQCLPDRLRRQRGERVDPGGLVFGALARLATRPLALRLIEADGSSKANALYTVLVRARSLEPEKRVAIYRALADVVRSDWRVVPEGIPRIVVGEAGTDAARLAMAVAAGLGVPLRVIDQPDWFKPSAMLAVFLDAVASDCVMYTETPPTPLAEFLMAGFGARVAVLMAASRPIGLSPGFSPVDDLAAPTDGDGSPDSRVWDLVTYEWTVSRWRQAWKGAVGRFGGLGWTVVDPLAEPVDAVAHRVAAALGAGAMAVATMPGGPLSPPQFATQSAELPAAALLEACRAVRRRDGDAVGPETPLPGPRPQVSPVDGLSEVDRTGLRRCLEDGDVAAARAVLERWSSDPVARLSLVLRHGPVAGPVQLDLLRAALPDRRPAPKIFLCGPPHSRAVGFARVASAASGWRMSNLAREAVVGTDGYSMLLLEEFVHTYDEPMVIWSHNPASPMAVALLRLFEIPVHVSVGVIWDELIREWSPNAPGAALRSGRIYRDSAIAPADQPWDVFLRGFARYVRYYVGWSRALRQGLVRGSIARFDQAEPDLPGLLQGLFRAAGAGVPDDRMRAAVAQAGGSEEPAVEIGGYDLFPGAIQDLAAGYYRRYPDIDFRMVDPRNPGI